MFLIQLNVTEISTAEIEIIKSNVLLESSA